MPDVISVAAGRADLATDFDRNLNAMLAGGRVRPDQPQLVWRSAPPHNDALAVRHDLDAATRQGIGGTVPAVTPVPFTPAPVAQAAVDILTLRKLGGGHGCNDVDDRLGMTKRRLHHAMF